ncbi:hypothetical protein FB451DRAFT_1376829 [Mycena latifolia]|nr:hypothetical protein FB451DRAFT_1376829 [Mycena latifolia]
MIILPTPPDALQDAEKWNSDWEALLRKDFAPRICFDARVLEIVTTPHGADDSMSGYQSLLFNTCAVQRNITEEALRHFTRDNLEARWTEAGADVRRRHILGAMAAVCSKSQNLNKARAYCAPEIRLSRLRLNGKVFLDLLKSLMHEDASFIPSKPIYVSHPAWDTFAAEQETLNDTEAKKIALAEILLLRTKLICHVVQFTLRSFLGLPPPELSVMKEHKSLEHAKNPLQPFHMAALVEALGPDAAKARANADRDGTKARIEQRRGHCSYLGCNNSEPPDGSQKFARCKKCFDTMERQVLYCSRTCQTADWKLEHKKVCGKALDFNTISQPVDHPASLSDPDKRIPLPINGYKRSLALTSQVTELNQSPTVDYRLHSRMGVRAIDFGAGSYLQVVFRAYRKMAMTTGDRQCVASIAHILCAVFMRTDPADVAPITPTMIVEQLAGEFVFDGLREAVLEMQELQNQDPLKLPPLLADAPPDLWTSIIEVIPFPDIVVTFD